MVQITDQDRGYAEAVRRLRQLKADRPFVKVGVSDVPHMPTGTPTDEIGAVHEFGLGVPQRSFLRAWADDGNRMTALNRVVESTMQAFLDGHTTLSVFLRGIGSWAVANIRQRINLGLVPALAPSTLKKGHGTGKPLLDTLQLEAAITHEASQ
jgi:hypothetical protein